MAHWVINCLYFFSTEAFKKSAAFNYKTVIRETFMKPALTSIRYKIIIFLTLFSVDFVLDSENKKIIKIIRAEDNDSSPQTSESLLDPECSDEEQRRRRTGPSSPL